MCSFRQLSLFDLNQAEHQPNLKRENLGTFQDSLRAPVHSWFVYPAGYSYKAVEEVFRVHQVTQGAVVYDPFAGTGTTNVVASLYGMDSIGIEAHPFVYFVAKTKTHWNFDLTVLISNIEKLVEEIRQRIRDERLGEIPLEQIFPELVRKCYSSEKLAKLYLCREAVLQIPSEPFHNFAKLALTNLLRSVADVATGWPYIAPQKAKKSNGREDVAAIFRTRMLTMVEDLRSLQLVATTVGRVTLIEGDSREQQDLPASSVDIAITSPPYLNNFDYADRTRLEMYFWGDARTWGDITSLVRSRLMMSATTQISRQNYDEKHLISDDLYSVAPQVANDLKAKVDQLSELRPRKGGKKSYDILVAGYFNDMLCTLREAYRLLKPNTSFVLILGDSAPYGIYVPTHTYLGEIAKGLGFFDYSLETLRQRGGKWKDNPQRHNIPLQECVLTLRKR